MAVKPSSLVLPVRPQKPRHGAAELAALSAKTKANGISQKREDNLTPTQKLFIKFMGEGDNQTNAAIRAGIKPSSASAIATQYRKHDIINRLIDAERAKYAEAAQMTRAKVMDGMLESIEMAKLMSEPSSMIAGWREIGKICGFYAPVEHKVKVDVTGNIVLDKLNSMSDAELLKIISQGATHAILPSAGAA